MRLQHGRAPRGDSGEQGASPDNHLDTRDADASHLQRRADLDRRRAARNGLSTSGYDLSEAPRAAPDEMSTSHAVIARRSVVEELEDIACLNMDDPKWVPLCTSIAASAHKLSPGNLGQAFQVVAGVSTTMVADGRGCNAGGTAAFRSVVDAVLMCITPHLASLSIVVVADALAAMAAARIEEQSYLDMLLVQLLVLLRRERSSFTPGMVASLAGAIGTLHAAGVSAKRAGSGASSAANKRCLDALAEQIAGSMGSFRAEELGRIGGAYLVAFTDDLLRRAVLARAAELGIGFGEGASQSELVAMQDIERATRQHSFAFIASLPDQTKDYLMKLKAAV